MRQPARSSGVASSSQRFRVNEAVVNPESSGPCGEHDMKATGRVSIATWSSAVARNRRAAPATIMVDPAPRHDRASEFDSWDCVDELVDAEDFSQEWGEAAAR